MSYFSKKKVLSTLIICVATLGIGTATVNAEGEKIEFKNQNTKEENIISLTDERTFEVSVDLPGKSKEELEEIVKEASWNLSREKGGMDEKSFPYQYKGGDLKEWKTFPTTVDEETKYPEKPYFKDIKTELNTCMV